MLELQRYPTKPFLIKYELDINIVGSLNCSFSFVVPQRELFAHSLLIRSNGETQKLIIFQVRKHKSDLRLQKYRCKSGIVILHGGSLNIMITVP